nr:MAG TPA: hypothetical protein [Caudoviricetes sp.]
MERGQFTFYRSFASALRRIRKDADRARAYDAICDYALDGKEPDLSGLSDAAAIAFELIKPTLDASKRKAENGKRGANAKQEQSASKPIANSKQADSKQKAKGKRGKASSEKENEIEREVENECSLPPITPFQGELKNAVDSWLRYKKERRESYKEEGLRNLVSQIRNNAEKYGESAVAEVIRTSMASGYQGIVFDRLGKGGQRQIPQQRIVQHGDAPGEFERRAMERMMQETPKGGWGDET